VYVRFWFLSYVIVLLPLIDNAVVLGVSAFLRSNSGAVKENS